jgi:hypothetical protein
LAKYTYALLPLEQYHKIEENQNKTLGWDGGKTIQT